MIYEPEAGPIWAASASFFIGVGMGMTSTAFIVSIQTTVSWQQRGIATASNIFMRNLGNTVGAALLGGILNNRIMAYFQNNQAVAVEHFTLDLTNALLREEDRQALSASMKAVLQEGLTVSLHTVYIVVFLLSLLSLLLITFLPKSENVKGDEG